MMERAFVPYDELGSPYWAELERVCRGLGWQIEEIPVSEKFPEFGTTGDVRDEFIPQGAWRIRTPDGFTLSVGQAWHQGNFFVFVDDEEVPQSWDDLFGYIAETTDWVRAHANGHGFVHSVMECIIDFVGLQSGEMESVLAGDRCCSLDRFANDVVLPAIRGEEVELENTFGDDTFHVMSLYVGLEEFIYTLMTPFSTKEPSYAIIPKHLSDMTRLMSCGKMELSLGDEEIRGDVFLSLSVEDVLDVFRRVVDLSTLYRMPPFMKAMEEFLELFDDENKTHRLYYEMMTVLDIDTAVQHEDEWMGIARKYGLDEFVDALVAGVPVKDVIA